MTNPPVNDLAAVRLTARLRLEPITRAHVDDLVRLHADTAVAQYYRSEWSHNDARTFAAAAADAWSSGRVHKWIAYDIATGELVGRGGLSYAFVDGAERLEVGWTLTSAAWGHGYATEIGRTALTIAFTELAADDVVSYTETGNRRSRAVMERLGMRNPRSIVHNGEPFVLYTINRSEP